MAFNEMITFEEIMAFHTDNEDVYREIKEHIQRIVPFVGAGMSAFCYPTWGTALNEIAQKIDPNKLPEFKKYIETYEYEKAASLLIEERTKINFFKDMKAVFPVQVDCRKDITQQAVYLLPYLFKNLVLTTNFEQVIETAYEKVGGRINFTGFPGMSSVLTEQLRTPIARVLYKFHGDIHNFDSIVFSEEQYEKAYEENSELVKDLKQSIQSRPLLFLGCSLNKDRTMSVLCDALNVGVVNYTIKNCKDESRFSEVKRLGEMNIRAILYPEGRYEAVLVILKRLLEDVDHEGYLYYLKNIPNQNSPTVNPLRYDSNLVNYFGRTECFTELESFCSSDGNLKWWAITGQGGIGKSRLAYEFIKKMKGHGWEGFFLNSNDYSDLKGMEKHFNKPTILVMDYAHAYIEEIINWLKSIVHSTKRIRILLLERDGKNFDDAYWIKYGHHLYGHDYFESTCYNRQFLNLGSLNIDDLRLLVKDYSSLTKKDISDSDVERLLEKLSSIDEELMRPLYALILVEAWDSGGSVLGWNKKEIVNILIDREKTILNNKIRSFFVESDQIAVEAFTGLKIIATVCREINLNATHGSLIKEQIETLENYFKNEKQFNTKMIAHGFADGDGIIKGYEPDIIGEYYVYTELICNEARKGKEAFIKYLWNNDKNKMRDFIIRLYNDFTDNFTQESEIISELFNLQQAVDDIEDIEVLRDILYYANLTVNNILWISQKAAGKAEELLELIKDDDYKAYGEVLYSRILVNLIIDQDLLDAQDSLSKLMELYSSHSDNVEIAVPLAKGLVNVSSKQELPEVQVSLSKLTALYETHSDNAEIAEALAQILFNVSVDQDLPEAQVSLSKLTALYETHSDNAEIAEALAQILYNVSVDQELPEAQVSLSKLADLYETRTDNAEIAVPLAKLLVNVSVDQELPDAQKSLSKVMQLYDSHLDNAEIAVSLAKLLVNLSVKQELSEAQVSLSKLTALYETHSDNAEIAEALAQILYNVSVDQELPEAQVSLSRLTKLYETYSDNAGIAVRLAKLLVNVSADQELPEAQVSLSKLTALYETYSDNAEIAEALAQILYNVSVDQDSPDRVASLSKVIELNKVHPDKTEIAVQLAKLLVNVSVDQELPEVQVSLSKLTALYETHLDNAEIAEALAHMLYNVSVDQELPESQVSLSKLTALYETHSNNAEIAVQLSKAVFIISVKQDLSGREESLSKLTALYETHSDNAEIAVSLAKLLVNLSVKQELPESQVNLSKLTEFYKTHTDNSEIAVSLAKLFVNVSAKQELPESQVSLSKLTELYKTHLDNSEIAVSLAKLLVNVSAKQELSEAQVSLSKLTALYETHSDNTEIAVRLANLLFNVSTNYELPEAQVSLSKLTELYETHSENVKIAVPLAKLLVNVSADQELPEAQVSLSKLTALHETHSDNTEIAVLLAKLLFNVSVDQDSPGREASLSKVMELNKTHPDNTEIAEIIEMLLSLS